MAAYSRLNRASINVYGNVNGRKVADAIRPTNRIAQDFPPPS